MRQCIDAANVDAMQATDADTESDTQSSNHTLIDIEGTSTDGSVEFEYDDTVHGQNTDWDHDAHDTSCV